MIMAWFSRDPALKKGVLFFLKLCMTVVGAPHCSAFGQHINSPQLLAASNGWHNTFGRIVNKGAM